jgi:tetratricopeptide (TPR) repeat protein
MARRTAAPSRALLACIAAACCGLTVAATAQEQDMLLPIEAAAAEAEQRLRAGETQLAESLYRTTLLEGLLLLGSLELAENDLDGALATFDAASGVAMETRRPRTSLALVHLRVGDTSAALGLLRSILAQNQDDVPSRRLLAQALAASGQPELALQELREALANEPEDLETAYALGMAYLRVGQIEAATELFDQIIEARPLARTHVLIGRTYRDLGQHDLARDELRAALELDSEARRAHFYLGTIELLTEQRTGIPAAVAEFEKELEIDPADPVTNLYLGMSLIEEQRPEEALQALEVASAAAGTRADALQYVGQARLALDQPAEAAVALRSALELMEAADSDDRTLSRVHYQLGLALRNSGDLEGAGIHFEAASQLGAELTESSREQLRGYMAGSEQLDVQGGVFLPPAIAALAALPTAERDGIRARVVTSVARAYFNLGVLAARAERHAEAARLLEEAAALDPDFPQLQYALGVAHFNARQYEQATEPLQAALDLTPGNTNLRRMAALAWLETEAYERTVSLLADDSQRAQNPSLQYAYGLALVRSGRAQEAEPVFNSLLEENDAWPELYVVLGQAAAQLGDYPAAIGALQRAIELDAEVTEARSALGYIYLTQGQLDSAEQVLRAELAVRPADVRARYLLAAVLELNQKPEEAMEALRDLLVRQPRFADGRYLLGKILVDTGSPGEAIAHLEAAAGLSPEDPNIHYQLGLAYQRSGRPDDAAVSFRRFQELKDAQDQELRQ